MDNAATCFSDSVLSALRPNEGICIDFHNDAHEVEDFFKCKNFGRAWYGNGIFHGGDATGNIENGCRQAVHIRDNLGYIKKVESWTVKGSDTFFKRLIDWGCDALIVSDGVRDQATQLLQDPRCADVRLATYNDSPFPQLIH